MTTFGKSLLLLTCSVCGLSGCVSSQPTSAEQFAEEFEINYEAAANSLVMCEDEAHSKPIVQNELGEKLFFGLEPENINYVARSDYADDSDLAALDVLYSSYKACYFNSEIEFRRIDSRIGDLIYVYNEFVSNILLQLYNRDITYGEANLASQRELGKIWSALWETYEALSLEISESHKAELAQRRRKWVNALSAFSAGYNAAQANKQSHNVHLPRVTTCHVVGRAIICNQY